MDEKRCAFCDDTEAQAEGGRLYKFDVRPDDAPPRPPTLISAECSESINYMVRTGHAFDGKVYPKEAAFPPIASHRFPLLGPNGQQSEALVEIGAPYTVDETTARCPVTITGPMPVPAYHAAGVDTLQALCLAVDHGWAILKELERQGWRWSVEPGSRDLDIMFGRRVIGRDPPGERPK